MKGTINLCLFSCCCTEKSITHCAIRRCCWGMCVFVCVHVNVQLLIHPRSHVESLNKLWPRCTLSLRSPSHSLTHSLLFVKNFWTVKTYHSVKLKKNSPACSCDGSTSLKWTKEMALHGSTTLLKPRSPKDPFLKITFQLFIIFSPIFGIQ